MFQYGPIKNYEVIGQHGAVPYIAYKSNHSGDGGRTGEFVKGRELWRRMYNEFHNYSDEYLKHYHQRSNVESVFSMIKRKFGHFQRSRTEIGMLNEALCKIICHNICCLNSAIFEIGLDLDHLLSPKLRPHNARLSEASLVGAATA